MIFNNVLQDATTLGIIRNVNYAAVPISVDMKNVPVYAGEVRRPQSRHIRLMMMRFLTGLTW